MLTGPTEPVLPGMDAVAQVYPAPLGPETRPPSYGRRLTARRNTDIARGVHPVTGALLLHPEWRRSCGDCAHLFRHGHGRRGFWKCGLNATRGPATDIRVSWPACASFREDAC